MKGSSSMRQLLTSLVSYGKVTTTEARAKSLKRQADRLISRSKSLSLVVRRKAFSVFPQKDTARKFLDQVVPQFRERIGGYVRVVKLAHRRGDRAPMARVEFVEEIKEKVKEVKESAAKSKVSQLPVKKKMTAKKLSKSKPAKTK